MNAAALSMRVKRSGLDLGFDAVGVATLGPNAHAAELQRWLDSGFAGTMGYLHRQAARRKDPRGILSGGRVAVVTLSNYFHAPAELDPVAPAGGRVAQYSWSTDYHRVLSERLDALAAAIRTVVPEAHTQCYVDAGPVPERELAQLAGLGWIGKNAMLLNPRLGSFTFIGVILTDADLAPDEPFEADRCGSCRRCLDACPTDAFVEPRMMDARRCISYLTIELRGEFSDAQLRSVDDWLFGCDVCQDVCPWNIRFARATEDPALAPRPDLTATDPDVFAKIGQAEFDDRFGGTPFERPGLVGMRRNAAAVRANQAAV